MATATITDAMARRLEEKRWAIISQLKELKSEQEEIENQLRDYVYETGQMEFGNTKAFEKATPAKLRFNGPASKGAMEAELLSLIPEVQKVSIDASKLYDLAQTDKKVERTLRKLKAEVTKETKLYFKHV